MNKTIIQVPIDKKIKEKAALVAADMGFSSLQETIRLFLTKLSQKSVHIRFNIEPDYIELSPKARVRYGQRERDLKEDKNLKSFTAEDEALRWLNS